jgi:uncharacterized protein (DUF1778 family)
VPIEYIVSTLKFLCIQKQHNALTFFDLRGTIIVTELKLREDIPMHEKASENIHMRTTPKLKALLQHAATLSGHTSLSGFISFVATQEAKKIIRREEATLLSDEGMDYVIDLLTNASEPSQNLKDLMSGAYRKQKKGKSNSSE